MSKSRRPLPASYVVRLYRADPSRIDSLAGLIEDVDAGMTTSFRSSTELLRQLHGSAGEPVPPAAGGRAVDSKTDTTTD